METRHVRIGYDEALRSKRNLLNSEINLLQITKSIRNYRLFRKKEFTARNKLKSQMKSLRLKFNLLASTFPEQEKVKTKKVVKKEDKVSRDVQEELEEIKRKLENLS
ncbi:hypothetical protein CMI42_05160 [Candidatus Pacearchaeota archaeon]|nr:hypothetical protein [Candidatus Pacearchaeota archaeon]|tara:strand:+ start:3082 stop:3402 length:321 start_codon:yes stop_codon:yes gene_type:complete